MTYINDCKESIDSQKKILRRTNKQLRKESFSEEKNFLIIENIRNSEVYKNSQKILAFYPLFYEIDLRELFIKNEDNKEWFLPKISENNLLVCPFEGEEQLIEGAFNVMEPKGDKKLNPAKLDLIILPALAVDRHGNRLGYGKGCYDRFLSSTTLKAFLLLPIFNNLIVDEVPHTELDQKVNAVVSESATYYIK